MVTTLARVFAARERVLRAALEVITGERLLDDELANARAVNAAEHRLQLAARDLYWAVEAQPADKRPKGWETR